MQEDQNRFEDFFDKKDNEEEKKKRKKEPTPECDSPAVSPECLPIRPAPEQGIINAEGNGGVKKRGGGRKRRHPLRVLYACVLVSFLLCFVLMIGAMCVLSVPESVPAQGDVSASADAEEKRVIWVHEYGEAEGAMSTPELYEACRKSVVSIRTEKGEGVGIGSGFVWRSDGYIATAAHVVEGCERIEVMLWDERRFEADLVGSDDLTDLALLKIECNGLMPVVIGESDELLTGERVVAIGTPASLDYAGSVCSGEVSCARRTVKIYSEESGLLEKKMKLIQMSAPVNPGNSGCPLFDGFGRVVGVVTMKLGQSFSGIGFAIPSEGATQILDAMLRGEKPSDGVLAAVSVRPASLGIEGESYEIGGTYGVRITRVIDTGESPLRTGDMLLNIEQTAVRSASDVEKTLQSYEPGDHALVTVLRNGQRLTFEVILTARAE